MKNKLFARNLSVLACALTLTGSAMGGVIDDFSSGDFAGGTGWNAPWAFRTYHSGPGQGSTASPDPTFSVTDATPINNGGNYFFIEDYIGERGSSYTRQSRAFDTNIVDNTKTHTVSFDFRAWSDKWSSPNSQRLFGIVARYSELNEFTRPSARTDSSWGVVYDSEKGWQALVYNATSGANERIAPESIFLLENDAVFHVTINVYAERNKFSLSITDGVRTEDWGGMEFDFMSENPSGTGGGNILTFFSETLTGNHMSYSIDNVAVIPEGNTAAMALGGFVLVAAAARPSALLQRIRR